MTNNDEDFREILESKRVEIVEYLNCDRTYLLSYLRSKRVFDEEDCEVIKAEKTSRARAAKCVDKLLKKGVHAYEHFLDVLQVENSRLYELITGEKATSKPSPLVAGNSDVNAGVSTLGLGMLAEHQQRLYSELQAVHSQYSTLLSAKQELEGLLVKAKKDLEFEKERRKEYEKRFNTLQMAAKTQNEGESVLFRECDVLQKGLADRDVYIIVLQMKLLAEKEERDALKIKCEELEQKVETMSRKLLRVCDNYNHERKHSMKLSEQIRIRDEDIQKLDTYKRQLRESKYKNGILEEERDCVVEELQELKKWAEALKQRFDMIEKEKYDFIEKNEYVTSNNANLQESVKCLQRKLSLTQLETGELRQRNDILNKDFEIYKKQRDCALDARKEAILERDKALCERDSIHRQCQELQKRKDKINDEKSELIQEYDSLKTRFKTSVEELGQVKRKLNEKELEVGDLSRKLDELKTRPNSTILKLNPKTPEKREEAQLENNVEEIKDEKEEKTNPWRDRKLKKLLNSMKLRISGTRPIPDDPSSDPVSPATENMTLQVLQCLLPNLNSRSYTSVLQSPQTTQSLSNTIERQMAMRRHSPNNTPALQKKAATISCIRGSQCLTEDEDDEVNKPQANNVDNLPDHFRDRVKPVDGQRQRSKSVPLL